MNVVVSKSIQPYVLKEVLQKATSMQNIPGPKEGQVAILVHNVYVEPVASGHAMRFCYMNEDVEVLQGTLPQLIQEPEFDKGVLWAGPINRGTSALLLFEMNGASKIVSALPVPDLVLNS